MISIENLTIRTDFELLKNVNVNFEPDLVYGIVGTNGSGKTTFLRAISGLVTYEGVIKNKSTEDTTDNVFYLESSTWFNPVLTGNDYIKLYNSLWDNRLSKQNIEAVIDYWEMNAFINKKISKYSLGMKQRLLLSLYMLSTSNCYLFDEPTLGLDKQSVSLFYNWITSVKKDKVILMTSHYESDILKLCDVVLEIDDTNILIQ